MLMGCWGFKGMKRVVHYISLINAFLCTSACRIQIRNHPSKCAVLTEALSFNTIIGTFWTNSVFGSLIYVKPSNAYLQFMSRSVLYISLSVWPILSFHVLVSGSALYLLASFGFGLSFRFNWGLAPHSQLYILGHLERTPS